MRFFSFMFAVALVTFAALFQPTQLKAESGWFVQLPLTSVHWGDTDWYDFNSQNYGIGAGYTWERESGWDTSLSIAAYSDSYACDAVGVRLRRVYQVSEYVALGGALHLTDKCTDPTSGNKTFAAPTASIVVDVTDRFAIAVDAAPAISDISPVGFAAFSLEYEF